MKERISYNPRKSNCLVYEETATGTRVELLTLGFKPQVLYDGAKLSLRQIKQRWPEGSEI